MQKKADSFGSETPSAIAKVEGNARRGHPLESIGVKRVHMRSVCNLTVEIGRKCARAADLHGKEEAGGKAEMLVEDQRIRHLFAASIANAAHRPCDPDRAVGNSL